MRVFPDRRRRRHRGRMTRGSRSPRAGDAATTSVVAGCLGRPVDAVPEGAAERVRTFRAWIDSLPPVPPAPLDRLDRSALYG